MPDLLILDIAMPGETGLSIARRIRARSGVPIVMLTAADDVVDRVVGLELGADDYIAKPFDLRELRARIETVLRRGRLTTDPQPEQPAPARLVRFGDLNLDLDARRLLARTARYWNSPRWSSTCWRRSPKIPTAC